MTYSEILSSTAIEYKVSEEDLAEVKLKSKDKYKIIGRSLPALDIPEKINGKARFGIDAYVPNMVYGKIVPPPTRVGSTIKGIDDSAAKVWDAKTGKELMALTGHHRGVNSAAYSAHRHI